MKITNFLLVLISLAIAGCAGNQKQSTEDFVTVDVTKSYPKKELILQDAMDVEYIPLETTDGFITQGIVMDVGKDIMIVRNRTPDGDIFIFDRNGKGLRKINRMGQGGEEYIFYLSGGVFLDEESGEIYLNDGVRYSFIVYDLDGNFKRRIQYKEGPFITNAFNFDKENILCMEDFWPQHDAETHRNSHFLISKQSGEIRDIEIPFEKKISSMLTLQDGEGTLINEIGPRNCLITPFQNNWTVMEPSSDTVYSCLSAENLRPIIVRTPAVQSMNPEIFLFPGVLTDRYFFMQTVKKETDWSKDAKLATTNLVYDRQEKTISQYTVKNADFTNRTEDLSVRAVNKDTFYFILEAAELVEANAKGELKGKLKEIAETLDEESNPVIMLAKYKE